MENQSYMKPSCNPHYEMSTMPKRAPNYQTLDSVREDTDSRKYMELRAINARPSDFLEEKHPPDIGMERKNSADDVIYQDISSLPPRAAPLDYEFYKHSPPQPEYLTTSLAADEQRANFKQGNCERRVICLAVFLTVLVAASILVSVAALAFGISTGKASSPAMPQMSFQNSSQLIVDVLNHLEDLKLQNSTTHPHDPINVTALITRLNETILALLLERIADLERNINDINIMQITFNSTLTNSNERLNSVSSQLRNTSSELTTISSRLNSNSARLTSLRSSLIRANLFNRCVKEENSCFVNRHSSNPRWYLCTTPARIINRSVSVAMICN